MKSPAREGDKAGRRRGRSSGDVRGAGTVGEVVVSIMSRTVGPTPDSLAPPPARSHVVIAAS
ncbi:hypothetical protein GCM10023201_30190 [Actinomycetospora corticicola]